MAIQSAVLGWSGPPAAASAGWARTRARRPCAGSARGVAGSVRMTKAFRHRPRVPRTPTRAVAGGGEARSVSVERGRTGSNGVSRNGWAGRSRPVQRCDLVCLGFGRVRRSGGRRDALAINKIPGSSGRAGTRPRRRAGPGSQGRAGWRVRIFQRSTLRRAAPPWSFAAVSARCGPRCGPRRPAAATPEGGYSSSFSARRSRAPAMGTEVRLDLPGPGAVAGQVGGRPPRRSAGPVAARPAGARRRAAAGSRPAAECSSASAATTAARRGQPLRRPPGRARPSGARAAGHRPAGPDGSGSAASGCGVGPADGAEPLRGVPPGAPAGERRAARSVAAAAGGRPAPPRRSPRRAAPGRATGRAAGRSGRVPATARGRWPGRGGCARGGCRTSGATGRAAAAAGRRGEHGGELLPGPLRLPCSASCRGERVAQLDQHLDVQRGVPQPVLRAAAGWTSRRPSGSSPGTARAPSPPACPGRPAGSRAAARPARCRTARVGR